MCKKEILSTETNYTFWQRDYHAECWKETMQGAQGYKPDSINQGVKNDQVPAKSYDPFAFPGIHLP